MPAPSKRTAERMRRVLELHREGRSARQIAEELQLDQKTIRLWLGGAGLQPNGGSGPRAARATKVRTPEARQAAEAAAAQLLAPPDLPPIVADRDGAVRVIVERLATVRSIIKQLEPLVVKGEYPANQFGQMVRLEADLASELAELAPPEPPDPERDPGNLEAAARVRARLAAAVESAERNARCMHCGEPPFISRVEYHGGSASSAR